jgi:hypothetical protein
VESPTQLYPTQKTQLIVERHRPQFQIVQTIPKMFQNTQQVSDVKFAALPVTKEKECQEYYYTQERDLLAEIINEEKKAKKEGREFYGFRDLRKLEAFKKRLEDASNVKYSIT